MTVTVLANQTLLDIALQYLGDANQAFAIAEMNGINLTDELPDTLTLPDVVNTQAVVNGVTVQPPFLVITAKGLKGDKGDACPACPPGSFDPTAVEGWDEGATQLLMNIEGAFKWVNQ